MKRLERDLGEPAPVPEAGMHRALAAIQSGQLTRYGELGGDGSEVAALEREFATYLNATYAVALNSGGSALFVALLCAGLKPGDKVLLNAFTLAPVPGAIVHAGAEPIFVECDADLSVDLGDLEIKATESGADVFLLSHMRGHIGDMSSIVEICRQHGITLIEDCAHTLGARWDGVPSGRFGQFGCFSLQAYKHINAGEGGILVTDDEHAAAKAVLYSGSYMLYEQNGAAPSADVFRKYAQTTPNFSLRMTELTAAVSRPQIKLLDERRLLWNKRYRQLEALLSRIDGVCVPSRDPREEFVGSSIQFSLTELSPAQIDRVVTQCAQRGVAIKWFGRTTPAGFTSTWHHWGYVTRPVLGDTDAVLQGLCDMRIPLSLTSDDCELIAMILRETINAENG